MIWENKDFVSLAEEDITVTDGTRYIDRAGIYVMDANGNMKWEKDTKLANISHILCR